MDFQFDRVAEGRRLPQVIAAIVLLAAAGCGGPANKYDAVVTGTITIDGELAPSGTVTFHPVAKEGMIAIGRIYPDGSFSLRTGQGDLRESDGGTVVPGEYIVTVVVTGPPAEPSTPGGGPPSAGPLLIAERYISRETTNLRCNISAGDNVVAFDVEGATPAEADAEESETPADGTDAAEHAPADENTEPAATDATPATEEGAAP